MLQKPLISVSQLQPFSFIYIIFSSLIKHTKQYKLYGLRKTIQEKSKESTKITTLAILLILFHQVSRAIKLFQRNILQGIWGRPCYYVYWAKCNRCQYQMIILNNYPEGFPQKRADIVLPQGKMMIMMMDDDDDGC